MRKREEDEVSPKVVHYDANGVTLEVNDQIRITDKNGSETAVIAQDHGEPMYVRRGNGNYLPLDYLLRKQNVKVEKL